MNIISGDCIDVTVGDKTTRGYALTDFDTADDNTDFELRRILKDDGIGAVVTFNTGKSKIKAVEDEKYSRDPIVHPNEDEEESDAS